MDDIDHISEFIGIGGAFADGLREARERRKLFIAEHGKEAWEQRLKKSAEIAMMETDRAAERYRSLLRLENSGFGKSAEEVEEFLQINSFDNFNAIEPWQKSMLDMCQRFIQQNKARFMYLSGQPGCGKTHLGTAVSAHYLNRGESTRYAIHGLLMTEMKANVNDDEEYYKLLNDCGECAVLYIDDFMKPVLDQVSGRVKPPTAADIDHSFRIINKRYVRGGITIITSERNIDEIISLDEAMGSRIKQMCGDYALDISRREGRNYRLKDK